MDALTDDNLVRLYRDGDATAFDALFARYGPQVHSFARYMVGEPAADDVLQETFLTVAESLASYREGSKGFGSWVMRIARHRCLRRIEAARVRPRSLAAMVDEVPDGSPDADPTLPLRRRERAGLVRDAVAALPDRQREAVALYAFDGMSYREIADVLEAPINTVKTLIRRGRIELARRLENDHGLPTDR